MNIHEDPKARINVPVDLTNPGQFFACCGLLELADRLWPGAQGWFDGGQFRLAVSVMAEDDPFAKLLDSITSSKLGNTMCDAQIDRLEQLGKMSKQHRSGSPGLELEKKELEALRREEPIVLGMPLGLRIDWFRDDDAGGSRFKTWAGQQSVLDIATAMKEGIPGAGVTSESTLWNHARRTGLPFNFDSDLGGQGSALDIGFSFDALNGSERTRIEGTCRPALELLAFIGLNRFRPREISGQNRFIYAAWHQPLPASVSAAATCQAIPADRAPCFEFRLLYRTKYLKSFLTAIPFQGDDNE
jgi:CRISPR-associated protein Csb3